MSREPVVNAEKARANARRTRRLPSAAVRRVLGWAVLGWAVLGWAVLEWDCAVCMMFSERFKTRQN